MSDRYTVSENLFGYEPHGDARWCRFAVVDNRPTRQSVYSARERCRVLVHVEEGKLAFRHVAFCVHRSDADALAAAMNGRTPVEPTRDPAQLELLK
jgi:hypothetical protein